MQTVDHVRVDKWLWAVRLFKTRSQATAACDAGHAKINGQSVKPARPVRVGDTLTVLCAGVQRTVKVLEILEHRVGAPAVARYMEDLTPPEEFQRAREQRESSPLVFPRGWGRPTKKQRRQMDQFFQKDPAGSDA
jgi:ribosome-associated heat shock protein Hsp15